MSKQKWLIVAFRPKYEDLDGIVGGDQVRPYELFKSFAQMGHRSHVWELEAEPQTERSYHDGSVRVRQLEAKLGALGTIKQVLEMRKILKQEMQWARENGIENVCFYQQVPVAVVFRMRLFPIVTQAGIFLIPFAKRLGFSVWAAVHDLSPDHELLAAERTQGANFFRYVRLKAAIGAWFQKKYLPAADFISSVSEPLSEELIKRYDLPRNRCEVFMSGYNETVLADVQPWRPPESGEKWTIGYLGSPADVAVSTILESVVALGRKNIRLVLAGRGMSAMVEALRSEWPDTEILEGIQYRNYAEIANRIDIWLMPFADSYLIEYAWQLKMPMALASGRPVVRTGGRAVESSGLQEHFFLTGSDSSSIATTLATVLDEPAAAYERTLAAQRAVKDYRWPLLIEDLFAKFEKAIL